MKLMKDISVWLAVLAAATPVNGQLAEWPSGKLAVATRHVPPFAIKDDDGHWSGITIDLMQEVVVDLNEHAEPPIVLEFRELTLKESLAAVESGEVDLAAGALTVNFEREERMDFSHPYHTSGLGIAVLSEKRSGWWHVLDRILSPTFLEVVGLLAGLLVLSGALIYFFERRRNPEQFGGGFWRGLGAGVWWSIVTATTVGYGDKAPITGVGRVLAVVWMLSGILVISAFTAAVTSSLTVGQLSARIRGPGDLPQVRVASVSDSTSQAYLRSRRIRHKAFRGLGDALAALDAGEVEAVVYDAPLLQFEVLHNYPKLHVLASTFERQDYAIAFPGGSLLREQVNRSVLRVISTPSWHERLAGYLGERP